MTIITADDNKWDALAAEFAAADVYFTAALHKSFETSLKRQALAYSFKSGGESFFFPFMIGEVPDFGGYDIETVYGYSGPLSTTHDAVFLQEAWDGYLQWAREKGVLCQIVRFNPLLENHKLYFEAGFTPERNTVWVDLKADFRANYHKRLRNYIVQCENMGMQLVELKDAAKFKDLYFSDMSRLQAGDYYYFEKEHFDYLGSSENAVIYGIEHEGQLISAISFLVYGKKIHAHLFGTDVTHELRHFAVKFLYHKVIELYASRGFEFMNMGGGRTNADDDSLFDFKRKYGGRLLPYYMAKTIIDPVAYKRVADAWEAREGKAVPQNYLQFYRIKQ